MTPETLRPHLALAQDQLAYERALRTSYEQRAATAVSSTGTLVAVMLGLAALRTRTASFELPSGTTAIGAAALILLLLAAASALTIALPRREGQIEETVLVQDEQSLRGRTETQVLQDVLNKTVELLRQLRASNKRRRTALGAALCLQGVGAVVLVTAVARLLL